MLRVLDLFSGIGAYALGVERAGMKVVAFCECEEFPQQVLRKHWPDVPIYDDVRTLTADTLRRDGIAVDVIIGGWPCQDLSFAGPRRGLDGERSGLWSEVARLIGELRPSYAILENSTGLLSSSPDGEPPGRDFGRVLGDLAQIRYDAEWHCLLAAGFDAPHLRDRLWIVAHPQHPTADDAGSYRAPEHVEREAELRDKQERQPRPVGEDVSNADDARLAKRSRIGGNARQAHKASAERADRSGGENASRPEGPPHDEADARCAGGVVDGTGGRAGGGDGGTGGVV